ncbi:MAG: hypothetical protein AAFU78_21640 [Cyanobacteria bacterium J06633_2]
MISEEEKKKLWLELNAVIEQWWDDSSTSAPMPFVGNEIHALMTTAALSVLLAVDDAQEYLKSEDMLKE